MPPKGLIEGALAQHVQNQPHSLAIRRCDFVLAQVAATFFAMIAVRWRGDACRARRRHGLLDGPRGEGGPAFGRAPGPIRHQLPR